MTSYNVDLLMQVREKIVNEPEKHNQPFWARAQSDPRKGGECGTAYCVAGWAAILDGQELAREKDFESDVWEAARVASMATIDQYARKALGLGGREAAIVFDGANSRPTVLQYLDALIDAGKNGEKAVLY